MSINYFYQAWNFHDLHFFISYYEVCIHSQSTSFWELLELCGKWWSRRREMRAWAKGHAPATFHSQPASGKAFPFWDWQSAPCITQKWSDIQLQQEWDISYMAKETNSLRCTMYFSILGNGTRDEAVSSYQLTKNCIILHLFYTICLKCALFCKIIPWYSD